MPPQKYIAGKLLGKTWQRMTLAGGDNEKLENYCGTAKKNGDVPELCQITRGY